MDAEGARALARRIEQGRPMDPSLAPPRKNSSPARPIFGVHIRRTVRTRITVDGRPALLRQRIHSTFVAGRWTSAVVESTLLYLE
jgi:hypothetical protein